LIKFIAKIGKLPLNATCCTITTLYTDTCKHRRKLELLNSQNQSSVAGDHLDILVHDLNSVSSRPSTASSTMHHRVASGVGLGVGSAKSLSPSKSSILGRSGSFSIQRSASHAQVVPSTIQQKASLEKIASQVHNDEDEDNIDYRLYGL
jgi:hypothetical protein